jgi:nucleoid-associated protein YgaU
MKPGTRILLAVLTLFMGVIVLYWGVFYRGAGDEPLLVNDPSLATPDDASTSAPNPQASGMGDLVPVGEPPERRVNADPVPRSSNLAPVLGRDEPTLEPWSGREGVAPGAGGRGPMHSAPPPVAPDLEPAPGETPVEAPGEATSVPSATGAPGSSRAAAREQPRSEPPAGDDSRAERPVERDPAAHTPYVVKEGDTLSSIAQEWFGQATRWDLIQQANPAVEPSRLRRGQILLLPARNTTRDHTERPGSRSGAYTVRSGDTLSSIARARLGDERHWRLLYQANRRLIGPNPDAIAVGMELIIPSRPPADAS